MKELFFNYIEIKKGDINFDKLKELFDNIGTPETQGLNEIYKNKETLQRYAKSLLISKSIITQEHLDRRIYNISIKKVDDNFRIIFSLNLFCGYDYVQDDVISELKRSRMFCKYFSEIEEQIKKEQINNINKLNEIIKEKDLKIEQLTIELDKDITKNYQSIPFKNLNDLNCAKFLDEDEKRMILGLEPKNKQGRKIWEK